MCRHKVVVSSCLSDERSPPYPPHKVGRLILRVFHHLQIEGRVPCLCRYLGTTGKRLWHGPVMRLPSACDSGKVTERASGIAATG
jgi:hypothetical protein